MVVEKPPRHPWAQLKNIHLNPCSTKDGRTTSTLINAHVFPRREKFCTHGGDDVVVLVVDGITLVRAARLQEQVVVRVPLQLQRLYNNKTTWSQARTVT